MSTGVTIKVDARKVQAMFRRLGRSIDEKTLLALVGQRHLNWIDKNFRAGGLETKWKKLSPNTIAGRRKGSSAILQDTGKLRQSFVDTVFGNRVSVGTKNKIAGFHHFGTKPYTIRPKRKRFLFFQTVNGPVFARVVRHPGLAARPLLPTKALGERLALQTVEKAIDKIIAQAERR